MSLSLPLTILPLCSYCVPERRTAMDLDRLLAASAEAADLAVTLQTVHERFESLKFQVEECIQNNLWSRSEQYPIPDHSDWEWPKTFTCFWVEYCAAFPQKPGRPCIYHTGDQKCPDFEFKPSGVIYDIPQGWSWLVGRNHIWKACDKCLQRLSFADQSMSQGYKHGRDRRGKASEAPPQGPQASQAS